MSLRNSISEPTPASIFLYLHEVFDNRLGGLPNGLGGNIGAIAGTMDNPPSSPLVLDLDGDGVELVSLAASSAYFDVNEDGFAERTGWVSGDDGLLALAAANDNVSFIDLHLAV